MKRIGDATIDMVLCDLPYGTTANKWDTVIPLPYLWEQYERIKARTKAATTNYRYFKPIATEKNTGKRYPTSIITMGLDKVRGFHPTQKPVALFEYLIRTYTNEGETVLDSCIGSGTTALACLNANRNFVGFESDAVYFQKALDRIEAVKNSNYLAEPNKTRVPTPPLVA